MKQLLFFLLFLPAFGFSQLRNTGGGTGTGNPVYSASPTFTGTPVGITATHVGLPNVTNESKATMFTSPTFTGTVTLPASTSLTTPVIGAATGTSLALSSFINEAKGADIASATTTDIGAATGNYIDVTGTTSITGLGTVQAGTRRIVRFTGALTLTHNATSLILPGAANITTVAGDVAIFISLGSGNWRCASFVPTTVTGSGGTVLATSPTLTTPNFTTGFKIATAAASGKIPIGDGTNYVASTPTYPNAAGNAKQIIQSDGTNFAVTTNNGGWDTLRVSGSNFTTSSTSLVDITGLVTGTLATATTYEFECVFYVNSSSTAGMAVGIQQSGGGTGQIGVWSGTATNAAATGMAIGSNALNTAGAACVLVNGDGSVNIKGFVKTGSSGSPTISAKALKTTSGTAIVYIGSVMRWRKVS